MGRWQVSFAGNKVSFLRWGFFWLNSFAASNVSDGRWIRLSASPIVSAMLPTLFRWISFVFAGRLLLVSQPWMVSASPRIRFLFVLFVSHFLPRKACFRGNGGNLIDAMSRSRYIRSVEKYRLILESSTIPRQGIGIHVVQICTSQHG